MGRREDIENAFKEILRSKPYQKVSVTDICVRAGITRAAFYMEFENKEDVVSALFEKHCVEKVRSVNDILSLQDRMPVEKAIGAILYEGIYEERDYYINLVGSIFGNDDVFIRVVTQSLNELNRKIIPSIGTITPQWKFDYSCYFFAASQAMYLQKWIHDKMAIPPRDLIDHYSWMTSSFWHQLIAEKSL